mmetsp:Transcript_98765/g.247550  ORF Transcript_98765/g.247550 Transcript_98765/m.247550 type:complete len:83 (-) Transcript_98765:135-383(-)
MVVAQTLVLARVAWPLAGTLVWPWREQRAHCTTPRPPGSGEGNAESPPGATEVPCRKMHDGIIEVWCQAVRSFTVLPCRRCI